MKVGDLVKFKAYDDSVALVLSIAQSPWGALVETLWTGDGGVRKHSWNDLEVIREGWYVS